MPFWQAVGELCLCIMDGYGLSFGNVQVVFDRMNGTRNETVVYTNEAIRPMFLIVFG